MDLEIMIIVIIIIFLINENLRFLVRIRKNAPINNGFKDFED